MEKSIYAVTEHRDGAFRKSTYEAIGAGFIFADAIQAKLKAIVLGDGVLKPAEHLGDYGVDEVLLAESAVLADYTSEAYADTLAGVLQDGSAAAVVLGASAQGKDLAARLASKIDGALIMDCTGLRFSDKTAVFTRPIFGGKVLADLVVDSGVPIVAVRPNVFDPPMFPKIPGIRTVPVSTAPSRVEVLAKHLSPPDKIALTEADVVVAGGRGTGGDFSPIESLAEALGGAVAASRTAVDEGWRPHAEQVGQTGVTVSPKLYIACGISGAIQHVAGMSEAKCVVAVNKDPEAPIFAKSDVGIVGDLFEVIPSLVEVLKKEKEAAAN